MYVHFDFDEKIFLYDYWGMESKQNNTKHQISEFEKLLNLASLCVYELII